MVKELRNKETFPEEEGDLLSKLRLMEAFDSPSSLDAITLYLPASSTATSVICMVAT